MSKRRRIFDVDLPEEELNSAAPDVAVLVPRDRRGPMATAVRENAESLKERSEREAQIRNENDALAHEHVRIKKLGLIVDLVEIGEIKTDKLSRDRSRIDAPDLDELKTSIRDIGLSNPIRVEKDPVGGFQLVQGLRRLKAYEELYEETSDERFKRIPAGLFVADDEIETTYRKMVDENLVRADISFAEMAKLAMAFAVDPRTGCSDVDEAVAVLFKSAGYQKRSYIRAFAQLLAALDGELKWPEAIPRNLGLDVRRKLEKQPEALGGLIATLGSIRDRDASDELEVLRAFAGEGGGSDAVDPSHQRSVSGNKRKPRGARTTFRIDRPDGGAKCVASHGRLELRAATDFSSFGRKKIEAAIEAFYAVLDDK